MRKSRSPKMWYSLTDSSVLEIVTEGLSLLSTCWCLGRFKGRNEASSDNASFGTRLEGTIGSVHRTISLHLPLANSQ